MTERRTVHAFDYVNRPYEVVRDALRRDGALEILSRATKTAAERPESS